MLLSFLFILLAFSPLLAEDQDKQPPRLTEIEREISNMELQKKQLKSEISSDYHQEMILELYGQKEGKDYEWHGLGESLKNAEISEHKAREKERVLQEINQKLSHSKEKKKPC